MQSSVVLEERTIFGMLPTRNPCGHKGSFGHVLSICGSEQYQGAAALAALGAVRCGAGIVTAAFPRAAYAGIAAKLTVAPLLPLPGNRQGTLHVSALPQILQKLPGKTAVLLGCGLGLNGDTKEIVHTLLREIELPLVLDADGINAAAAHINILNQRKCRQLILTPHPGEMAKLCDRTPEEIMRNPAEIAENFANKYHLVLVLKSAETIIAAPNQAPVTCPLSPNSGLAKGGSGDLLAGMIVSFLAQGLQSFEAAVCGVYLHGKAAKSAAEQHSARSMTADEVLEQLTINNEQ